MATSATVKPRAPRASELGVRVRGEDQNRLIAAHQFNGGLGITDHRSGGLKHLAPEATDVGQLARCEAGGGRDMLKFKGEEYRLQWQGRTGFARLAIAHDYPIVPVGLVGGDDVYRSLVERDGTWERMTRGVGERLHGVRGVGIPLIRGVGPTLVPRPQRMYLLFGPAITTARPAGGKAATWEKTVKDRTQTALELVLKDLQACRKRDPFRHLNPLTWARALGPAPAG